MAFANAQKARVLIGSVATGTYNLSPVTAQASSSADTDMLDHTTLNDTAKVFIPGQDTSTYTVSGWLDTSGASGDHFDQLNDFKASASPYLLTYVPVGFAVGSPAEMVQGNEVSFTLGSEVAGKNQYQLETQTTGLTSFGSSLHDLTAETGTMNGTVLDNGAATTAGAVAYLFVTSFTGTNCTIIVQHSTDNFSSSATLLSFSTVPGSTPERVAVAGTVNRYLRVAITGGTFSSVTFTVVIARN